MIAIVPYLERIDYKGSREPSIQNLKRLHQKHLLSVPFENLDVHYNNPIHLQIDKLYNKIVVNRRGGFCYELNGLFAALLKELGYDIRLLSANVYEGEEKGFSAKFDHLTILVNLPKNQWLVDVGFGDFIHEPLKIDTTADQVDRYNTYRVRELGKNLYLVEQKQAAADWKPEYKFTTKGYYLDNFKQRCRFHQTSSESHVPKKKVCSIATTSGRITLTGEKLKITEDGSVKERAVSTQQEFKECLTKYFDIDLQYLLS